MNTYSPLKNIRIKNFRNLGDVQFSFEQSPIITLVGENDAGKTSVIKAFAMCALHDNPRDQKEYIRDNTDMLGIEFTLEDGTVILRVKQNNGLNMYRVIEPDGKVWDTTKITDGLPKLVQDKMGLIMEPETGEYLHVRTYEDKLLFVVTASSTNYKVMYNALKVEQLTKAIKLGSNEVNELKAAISRNDNSTVTLNEQLKDIVVVDTEQLVEIKNRLKEQIKLLDELNKARGLIERLEQKKMELGALALINIYKLGDIDESLVSSLSNANRLLKNLSEKNNCRELFKELDSTEPIDISVLERAENIIKKKGNLEAKKREQSAISGVASLDVISETLIMQIKSVSNVMEKFKSAKEKISSIDVSQCDEITTDDINSWQSASQILQKVKMIESKKKEVEQYKQYINQVEDYLKQCGVAVEICSKCGEPVIFDIDKVNS